MSLRFEEPAPMKIKVEAMHPIDSINRESESIKKKTVFIKEELDFFKEYHKWENSTEVCLLPDIKIKVESIKDVTGSVEDEPNRGNVETSSDNSLEHRSGLWRHRYNSVSESPSSPLADCRQKQLTQRDCPALWVECVVNCKPFSENSDEPTDHTHLPHEPTEHLSHATSLTHEGKPYSCKICQKNFSRSSHLKRHIMSHSGEKLYSCATCKEKFTRHGDLPRHIKKKHRENEPIPKQINEASNKLEKGTRPFSCELCEKNFIRSSHLKRHLKSHSGERLYDCNICQIKFTRSSDLKRHIKNHMGEIPFYTCHLCKKEFSQSSNLKRHEQLHTGIKPYSCDICNKKFTELGHLKTHKRIHSGEKPCICDICEMKFTKVSDLRRHQITHTKAKPYSCELCEKKFTRLTHLRIHKNNSHGPEPILSIRMKRSYGM